jgi:hypothetical protein
MIESSLQLSTTVGDESLIAGFTITNRNARSRIYLIPLLEIPFPACSGGRKFKSLLFSSLRFGNLIFQTLYSDQFKEICVNIEN